VDVLSEQPLNIVFAGTPEFAADHLGALLLAERSIVGVFTQPDKPGKRGRQSIASPVKLLCVDQNLPIYQPPVIDETAIAELKALRPDLMVVVAYGHKLPREVLDLPPLGCINVHASLLPRWRGAAPIQRAIQAGDRQSGVTIMQMDEGWDTGDVLHNASCPLSEGETGASLQKKLSALGQTAVNHVIDSLLEGNLIATPQSDEGSCYAKKVSKSEAAIDWSQSAQQIQRNIRAYIPNPVAHCWLDSLRVRIWEAKVAEESKDDAHPGEITAMSDEGIFVRCGTGTLRLLRVQLPIGKGSIVSPRDLLNARRALFLPGSRLTAAGNHP
jgi:methionyl-tRNA formyltransferase